MRPQFRERVGKTLAEKYKLQRLLGVGGMSAVYEAENTWTGRRVAIKLLTADADGDVERAQRFMKEARAATKVEHPNIVQVLDMGRDPADETLFIVEELLEGSDLRAVLDEREVLPPRAALEIILPVMSAVAAANAQGIIHRDIKPANIFLARGPKGEVVTKVIDFGVVKVGSESDITKTGTTIGTPEYMSPEQANGDPSLDAQTDVWSTGVVLYEMLAGHCPFGHENYHSLLVQILWNPIPRLDVENPDIPASFADVVHRAIERDRTKRFETMGEFIDAVLECPAFAEEPWHRALVETFRPAAVIPSIDSASHVVAPAPSLPPDATEHVDRDDLTTEKRPVADAPAPVAGSTFEGHIPSGESVSVQVPIADEDLEAVGGLSRRSRANRRRLWRGATVTGIALSIVLGLVGAFGSNRAIVHALRPPAASPSTSVPPPTTRIVAATTTPAPSTAPSGEVANPQPVVVAATAPTETVATPSPSAAAPRAADPPADPAPAANDPDPASQPDLVFAAPEDEDPPRRGPHHNAGHRSRASTGTTTRTHHHVAHTANGAPILGVP